MEQKIDKEVFDTFFHENYVPVEYSNIKEEFEELGEQGYDLFTEELGDKKLTKKNYFLYFRGDVYCQFEDIVAEAFESLNPEIMDAVLDISATMDNQDEITAIYWDNLELLLHSFLDQFFDEVISKWDEE